MENSQRTQPWTASRLCVRFQMRIERVGFQSASESRANIAMQFDTAVITRPSSNPSRNETKLSRSTGCCSNGFLGWEGSAFCRFFHARLHNSPHAILLPIISSSMAKHWESSNDFRIIKLRCFVQSPLFFRLVFTLIVGNSLTTPCASSIDAFAFPSNLSRLSNEACAITLINLNVNYGMGRRSAFLRV